MVWAWFMVRPIAMLVRTLEKSLKQEEAGKEVADGVGAMVSTKQRGEARVLRFPTPASLLMPVRWQRNFGRKKLLSSWPL